MCTSIGKCSNSHLYSFLSSRCFCWLCVQTDIARLRLVTLATAIDKNGFRFYSQNKTWSKVKLRMVSQGNCVTGSLAQAILHRVEFAEKSSSHVFQEAHHRSCNMIRRESDAPTGVDGMPKGSVRRRERTHYCGFLFAVSCPAAGLLPCSASAWTRFYQED